jgi:hypothetical protein
VATRHVSADGLERKTTRIQLDRRVRVAKLSVRLVLGRCSESLARADEIHRGAPRLDERASGPRWCRVSRLGTEPHSFASDRYEQHSEDDGATFCHVSGFHAGPGHRPGLAT